MELAASVRQKETIMSDQESGEHIIDPQWLPVLYCAKRWFEITDPTCIEVGDLLFDPHSWAHYAGVVLYVGEHILKIQWLKSLSNIFEDTIHVDKLTEYWWADPVMQNTLHDGKRGK